jgi:hypothetical protein
MDSAIGLSTILAIGPENFGDMLSQQGKPARQQAGFKKKALRVRQRG